ncbi:MAG: alkaline phosphatase family protein [Phycisphaerales bacterium]|nr:alkaline phosphatase family protein [Phycisphaerales bacterium]
MNLKTNNSGPSLDFTRRNTCDISMRGKILAPVMALLCLGLAAFTTGRAIANEARIIAGPTFTSSVHGKMTIWVQTDRPVDLFWSPTVSKWPTDYPAISKEMCNEPHFRELPAKNRKRNIHTASINVVHGATYDIGISQGKRGDAFPELLDKFEISVPPKKGQSGRYTIAFGSCAHHGRFPTQPIWEAVTKEKPDCFLFIGDNIYLPSKARKYPESRDGVVKLYRNFYDKNRQVTQLQPLLNTTFIYAIWDDHDYGPNNSDRTWKWKDVALEVFREYFPGNYGLPQAPGCFHRFAWGDVDVFMLDDRSFRDPNFDAARKTFLGNEQLAWLKKGLADSNATFKLVVCGNQMLTDGHPHESWGVLFPKERDAFLRWLWDQKIQDVLFLAGDRHFAELVKKSDPQKKGPDLWELTSSPLANRHFGKATMLLKSNRVGAYDKGVNFGLLRFDTTVKPAQVELLVKDETGKTVIRQVVSQKK